MMESMVKDEVIQNLKDAGFNKKQIDEFLQEHNYDRQIVLLKCFRCNLLNKVHEVNSKIDCLDYLIYQMQKNKKEG